MNKKGLFYYDVFVSILIGIASFICLYGFIQSDNYTMVIYSSFFIIWALIIAFRKMKKSYKRLNE